MSHNERMNDERTHWPQIIGSIVVALAIVAVAILITTSKFGNTSSAEIQAREDRIDLQEERAKDRQDALEERLKASEDRREEASE
jgi:type VI protein secretion system component VasK